MKVRRTWKQWFDRYVAGWLVLFAWIAIPCAICWLVRLGIGRSQVLGTIGLVMMVGGLAIEFIAAVLIACRSLTGMRLRTGIGLMVLGGIGFYLGVIIVAFFSGDGGPSGPAE